jgi:predicted MFS family arabinose efflux permease
VAAGRSAATAARSSGLTATTEAELVAPGSIGGPPDVIDLGDSGRLEPDVADSGSAPASPAPADEGGMRRQIMSGLSYIGRHRFLASIAASTATSNLFSNIAFAIFPVYLYRTLGLTPETVGAIGGIGGAGVLIGALVASRVARVAGVGPTIVGSIGLGGVMGLLVPLAPQDGGAFWFLAASFFFGSMSSVVYNVNQVSLRQAITPERFLGRMNATMRFLVWGTIPIGSLIGAGLSEIVGVHTTIWIGAILGVFAFLPVLLSPVRSLRTIPTEDPDAAPAT